MLSGIASGLRIVQLSQESSVNGGVGAYVARLSNALIAAGHEVIHVHADPTPATPVSPSPTARLPRLQETRATDGLANDPSARAGLLQFAVPHFAEFAGASECRARADRVLEILHCVEPDVVYIQSNNNFLLEEEVRQRYPAIKFLHVYDFCPSGNKYHYLSGHACQHSTGPLCILRMGYKRCLLTKRPSVILNHYRRCVDANLNNAAFSRLLVASQYVKEQAIGSGYSEDALEVVPYFVKPADPSAIGPGDGKTILFVGRVAPEKGLQLLLRALARMPEKSRLVVAGAGGDLDQCKRFASRMGLTHRTEFLGWVDTGGLPALYSNAAVVAVPSVWPEPFGIVGIEAMSHGKPVVAFRVGGIPEWLEHGVTGFAVPPRDVGEMARRLTYLLDHPDIAHEMGQQGRRSADENFNPERHVAQLVDIFREVMNARTSGATATA
jgi:glycosyltransferase involved in cell wall biosynthesis